MAERVRALVQVICACAALRHSTKHINGFDIPLPFETYEGRVIVDNKTGRADIRG